MGSCRRVHQSAPAIPIGDDAHDIILVVHVPMGDIHLDGVGLTDLVELDVRLTVLRQKQGRFV